VLQACVLGRLAVELCMRLVGLVVLDCQA
jgi:hypothetical protein